MIFFFSDSYTKARSKAKQSEITSDLSTTELSEATQNLHHTKNIKRKKIEKKRKLFDVELWSPASCDDLSNLKKIINNNTD